MKRAAAKVRRPATGSSAAHAELVHEIRADFGLQTDVRLAPNPSGFDERALAHYGLWPGASDLIGIVKPRGRFLALEVKTGDARCTEQQQRFLDMVNNMGGVGREVRSLADARAALNEARR